MNAETVAQLKFEGYMAQQQEGYCAVRIITLAGNMTGEQMKSISDIAEKYGRGYMSFTTRLAVEIPWIKYSEVDEVKKAIADANLETGGTGGTVRPIIACKGTVCSHGLIDTHKIASDWHEKYLGDRTPGKFKIGIGGCQNNCGKIQTNDFGIVAQVKARVIEDKCTGCNICIDSCKRMVDAITIKDGKAKIDYSKCTNCGKCIEDCKFNAIVEEDRGVAVYLGGKFASTRRTGTELNKIYSIEEAENIMVKAMEYYNAHGETKERFGDLLDRIGLNEAIDEITSEVDKARDKAYA